jgi:tetratricopeptide (TPR) repeat protein
MRIALGMLAAAAVAALALFISSAEARYRHAELLYQKGDFEKALLQCEKALQRNPRHAAAGALVTEVQFILGRGKATPATAEYDHFMHGSLIPGPQVLNDIDQALRRAERHWQAGEREAADFEVRRILEYVKWMPSGAEMDARRHEVEVLQARLATDGSPDD